MTTVDILGRSYNIRGEHDPNMIRVLARYVDSRMRQMEERVGPGDALGVAVLAALNIADDYYRTRTALEKHQNEVSERTRDLADELSQDLEPVNEELGQPHDE
jgi:cell division protein ZapA